MVLKVGPQCEWLLPMWVEAFWAKIFNALSRFVHQLTKFLKDNKLNSA